ncbi:DUF413 domain-containing protein [Alkalimarinus coralli]|uniref:DUF413 domain-containing protein n=1 Tax=Alkalimarinus coralli TaxID=2935863 RepID=UPI00202ADF83|nr:DUF413 domain-containing protein [Alkalimarinus coralli]
MSIELFASQCEFYDAVNFPHGFRRSGEFTLAESDILSRCGYTIKQLINKRLEPQNEEQERILKVITGEVEATSNVEKAWSKYLSKTSQKAHMKRCILSDVINDADYSSDDYAYDDEA